MLSGKDQAILDLILDGRTDDEIAELLDISSRTVRRRIVLMSSLLGCSSGKRPELVGKALRTGEIR